jgi:hypothetical protein
VATADSKNLEAAFRLADERMYTDKRMHKQNRQKPHAPLMD